jgi:hypothetical protein
MRCRCRYLIYVITLVGIALAAYFEPTRCVRGWLAGEAFYQWRPTSYWGQEIQHWDYVGTVQQNPAALIEAYKRRSSWPEWIGRFLPEPEAQWPQLLDGDAEGLGVLEELLNHPSEDVRGWARIGIERLDNTERGAWKRQIKLRWAVPFL